MTEPPLLQVAVALSPPPPVPSPYVWADQGGVSLLCRPGGADPRSLVTDLAVGWDVQVRSPLLMARPTAHDPADRLPEARVAELQAALEEVRGVGELTVREQVALPSREDPPLQPQRASGAAWLKARAAARRAELDAEDHGARLQREVCASLDISALNCMHYVSVDLHQGVRVVRVVIRVPVDRIPVVKTSLSLAEFRQGRSIRILGPYPPAIKKISAQVPATR